MRWILAIIFLLLVLGCSTSPFTVPDEDQAVMVLVLENLTNQHQMITLFLGGRNRYLSFPPREKSLHAFVVNPWEQKIFKVERNTVNLYSQVYQLTEEGIIYRDLIPEDKRLAAELLLDTYGYYHWADRTPVNFYPYQPRRFHLDRFPVALETNVPADAWVDGVNWGTTPLVVHIPAGKHQIIYRRDDQELFRTFIEVEGESTWVHSIPEQVMDEEDRLRIVMGSVKNVGEKSLDYLQPLIEEGIAAEISSGSPILLLLSDKENPGEDAEAQGAEMLLRGSYYSEDSRLLIHVDLMDVKTGQVRSSQLYQADLGLDILGNIQTIAGEVSQSVRRELPEPGETFYQVVDHFDESLIVLEQALALDYIEEIHGPHKNIIAVGLELPFQYALNHDNNSRALSLISFWASYDRIFLKDWSLRVSYTYTYNAGQQIFLVDGASFYQYHSISTDVLYSLSSSEQRNLYIGGGVAYKLLDNSSFSLTGEGGSLSLLEGAFLEPRVVGGARIYTKQRITEKLSFVGVDFQIPFAVLMISDGDNIEILNPFNISLSAGRRF